MIIVLDLDNCIADDAWRMNRIDWTQQNPDRRYAAYHALAAFDEPGNRDLWEDAPDSSCLVITARPEEFRLQTEEWLLRAGVPVLDVLMRQPGDHRMSSLLKEEQLVRYMTKHDVRAFEILAAYDDRPDVVEMYRRNGLTAFVRAIHDVCAMTPPTTKKDAA